MVLGGGGVESAGATAGTGAAESCWAAATDPRAQAATNANAGAKARMEAPDEGAAKVQGWGRVHKRRDGEAARNSRRSRSSYVS